MKKLITLLLLVVTVTCYSQSRSNYWGDPLIKGNLTVTGGLAGISGVGMVDAGITTRTWVGASAGTMLIGAGGDGFRPTVYAGINIGNEENGWMFFGGAAYGRKVNYTDETFHQFHKNGVTPMGGIRYNKYQFVMYGMWNGYSPQITIGWNFHRKW